MGRGTDERPLLYGQRRLKQLALDQSSLSKQERISLADCLAAARLGQFAPALVHLAQRRRRRLFQDSLRHQLLEILINEPRLPPVGKMLSLFSLEYPERIISGLGGVSDQRLHLFRSGQEIATAYWWPDQKNGDEPALVACGQDLGNSALYVHRSDWEIKTSQRCPDCLRLAGSYLPPSQARPGTDLERVGLADRFDRQVRGPLTALLDQEPDVVSFDAELRRIYDSELTCLIAERLADDDLATASLLGEQKATEVIAAGYDARDLPRFSAEEWQEMIRQCGARGKDALAEAVERVVDEYGFTNC